VSESKKLDGHVALVTGSRRGIGKAEAVALAAAGAKVVVCDIVDDFSEVMQEIAEVDGECIGVRCDVADRGDIENVVGEAVAAFGKVDILVNNAQAGLTPVTWDQMTDEIVNLSLATGPLASWRFMNAVFPYMKEQRWGRIINTSSGASRGNVPDFGHYAMAKGAITSLTYAAATDWGQYGITVNVLFPVLLTDALQAYYDADPARRPAAEARVPVRFTGEPLRDLGPLITFLASDEARYLTSHPFFIDGGAHNGPR